MKPVWMLQGDTRGRCLAPEVALSDSGFFLATDYSGVTTGDPMRVTVNAPPTPAPEPGMLALMLGGIGALGLARRRKLPN